LGTFHDPSVGFSRHRLTDWFDLGNHILIDLPRGSVPTPRSVAGSRSQSGDRPCCLDQLDRLILGPVPAGFVTSKNKYLAERNKSSEVDKATKDGVGTFLRYGNYASWGDEPSCPVLFAVTGYSTAVKQHLEPIQKDYQDENFPSHCLYDGTYCCIRNSCQQVLFKTYPELIGSWCLDGAINEKHIRYTFDRMDGD
jgi:hypothetical protein